jgi:uncharacterized protein (DUF1684 family)
MAKRYLIFLVLVLLVFSCKKNDDITKLDEQYISHIKKERADKDNEMQNDPNSPFNIDSTAKFEPLKYFEPTSEFIFKSKLYRNENPDTIKVYGTKGEERKAVKFGYVVLDYKGKNYKLNVYKSFGKNGQEYYSIWFTDKTTGNETYHVGRYLDFELNPDLDFIYTIDFNKAYNPYCSYSSRYTCAVPTKDDYLDFEIKAGEKNFHKE